MNVVVWELDLSVSFNPISPVHRLLVFFVCESPPPPTQGSHESGEGNGTRRAIKDTPKLALLGRDSFGLLEKLHGLL